MKNNHMKEATSRNEKKTGKNRLKYFVRCIVLLHPVLLTVIIVGFLFLFAFFFCWISVELDSGRWVKLGEYLTYLYTEWSIVDALSLLVGYLGMGSTIVLGIIALRFSFKTEEREQIERLQNITIKSVCFYNMFDDFVPSKLKYNDIKECQFLLELELLGERSGYEFQIEKVLWGNCDEKYESDAKKELNHCKTYVENATVTTINVYFDEFEFISGEGKDGDDKNSISYFYHIRDYEPSLMKRNMRYRWIQLDMNVREKVWTKNQIPKEFTAELDILIENRNDRKEKQGWIELHEIRHNIKIDNTKDNTNEMR